MKELLKDLKYIELATKSIRILNIIRALLTVGIIVFSVLKGKKMTEKVIEIKNP